MVRRRGTARRGRPDRGRPGHPRDRPSARPPRHVRAGGGPVTAVRLALTELRRVTRRSPAAGCARGARARADPLRRPLPLRQQGPLRRSRPGARRGRRRGRRHDARQRREPRGRRPGGHRARGLPQLRLAPRRAGRGRGRGRGRHVRLRPRRPEGLLARPGVQRRVHPGAGAAPGAHQRRQQLPRPHDRQPGRRPGDEERRLAGELDGREPAPGRLRHDPRRGRRGGRRRGPARRRAGRRRLGCPARWRPVPASWRQASRSSLAGSKELSAGADQAAARGRQPLGRGDPG